MRSTSTCSLLNRRSWTCFMTWRPETMANPWRSLLSKIGLMKHMSTISPLFVPLGSSGTDVSLCRMHGRIQNFEISITHNDLHQFLWVNEDVDEGDMKKGFLRGDVLVKVHVFFSSAPFLVHLSNVSRPSYRSICPMPWRSKQQSRRVCRSVQLANTDSWSTCVCCNGCRFT